MTSDLAMTDIQVEELLGEAVFELGATVCCILS